MSYPKYCQNGKYYPQETRKSEDTSWLQGFINAVIMWLAYGFGFAVIYLGYRLVAQPIIWQLTHIFTNLGQ